MRIQRWIKSLIQKLRGAESSTDIRAATAFKGDLGITLIRAKPKWYQRKRVTRHA